MTSPEPRLSDFAANEAVETLQHALGLDREKREPWRNYYCAEDGEPKLEALVARGLMQRGRTLNGERDRYYHVTEAGIAAAKAGLPKPYTRAQQRYRRFLDAKDAYPDMTFREFLARLRSELSPERGGAGKGAEG